MLTDSEHAAKYVLQRRRERTKYASKAAIARAERRAERYMHKSGHPPSHIIEKMRLIDVEVAPKQRDVRSRPKKKAVKYGPHEPIVADQSVVQKLTNWQRNQWARNGYPKDVKRFLELDRRFLELDQPCVVFQETLSS